SGRLRPGDVVLLMSDGRKTEIKEVGIFIPGMQGVDELDAGAVGYVVTNTKEVADVSIGDTITLASNPATEMLPGYQLVNPMVFAGVYPIDTNDYEKLKTAVGKLRLNDSALVYTAETSVALGFGFRCG